MSRKGSSTFLSLTLVLLFISMGCTGTPSFVVDENYETTKIPDRLIRPELPEKVIKKALETAPESFDTKKISPEEIGNHLKRGSVEIYLNEDRGSPFGGKNQKLILGGGAGEIDLSDYIVTDKPASFRIGFRLVTPETENFHLVFFNEARKREIDGSSSSLNCGEYVNLKDLEDRLTQGEGLLVLTAGERHVTLLSGIYYIIAYSETTVHISHFRIKDSRFPELSCVR